MSIDSISSIHITPNLPNNKAKTTSTINSQNKAIVVTNIQASNALIEAAYDGDIREVSSLLKVIGISANFQDNSGSTALSESAYKGHTEIALALLKVKDINVNLRDQNDVTPLMWAAKKGSTALVGALLKIKAIEVTPKDGWGFTALKNAKDNGHTEIEKMISKKIKRDLLITELESIPLPSALLDIISEYTLE